MSVFPVTGLLLPGAFERAHGAATRGTQLPKERYMIRNIRNNQANCSCFLKVTTPWPSDVYVHRTNDLPVDRPQLFELLRQLPCESVRIFRLDVLTNHCHPVGAQ